MPGVNGAVLGWPGPLPAHGVGNRGDLPLPFSYALTGAVIALVVSFVALALLWRTPRLKGAAAGQPVPSGLAQALDGTTFRWVMRALGLALAAFFLVALFVGPDDRRNPAAGLVYVLLWVGILCVLSVLLGPVWKLLNPLRTLHLLGCLAVRRDPREGLATLPPGVGRWPAAVVLLGFAWMELVSEDPAGFGTLQSYVLAYALVVLWGAAVFGSGWFEAADGFEVMSSMYGRLSVLGRRADRALVWRNPLDGVAGLRAVPGTVAVVSVLLATTAYDGLTSNPWWRRNVIESGNDQQVMGTLGLFGMVLLVAATYLLACRISQALGGIRTSLARPLAHSIIPIALGYFVAHYYSLLVVVGQQTIAQSGDPLVRGDNWLGLTDWTVSYALVGPTAVAVIQVVAVVTGHVLGVVLAHDRTIALVPRRHAVVAQVPLLALMVVYTLGGLTLLFST